MATHQQGDALALNFSDAQALKASGTAFDFSPASEEALTARMSTASWFKSNGEAEITALDFALNDPFRAAGDATQRKEIVVAALPPDGGDLTDAEPPAEEPETEPEPREFGEIQTEFNQVLESVGPDSTEDERAAAIDSALKLIDEQQLNTNTEFTNVYNIDGMDDLFDEAFNDAQQVFDAIPDPYKNSETLRRNIELLAPLMLSGETESAKKLIEILSSISGDLAGPLEAHRKFLENMAKGNADFLQQHNPNMKPFIQEYNNEKSMLDDFLLEFSPK